MDRVLVVGGSVAGVGVVNELRRLGFAGEVVLIEAGRHLPYDRPPLSKAVLLGEAAEARLPFHDAAHYAGLRVEVRLSSPVAALDAEARAVVLASGERLAGDAVVIATGARARPFPADRADGPVPVIRDLDDAVALRGRFRPGARLAVIGGGFVGAEVASSARSAGLSVTVFEAAAMPFARVLGDAVAAEVLALHREAGVALRLGVTVDRVARTPAGYRLDLSDGTSAAADLVVAGLGAVPNVEWLAGSGLDAADGIACDALGRTAAPGIHAAGDVASWPDPRTGRRARHEHWTAAREQARIVAGDIADVRERRWESFVPYFWSDLHGKRLQLLGAPDPSDAVEFVHRHPARGAFVAEYRRGGALVGVAGLNAAARTMRYLPRLEAAPAA